jgi:hypothetical protein
VARTPEAAPLVAGGDDEPLVLSGPPAALTGSVRLRNPGDRTVVLRDADLRDPSGALPLPEARHAFAPLVLRPDQARSLPLSIALNRAIPPGTYEVELEVGGLTRTAVLHVAESVALDVEPDPVVVPNQGGVPQRKRLVVTNEGNVPVKVGDPVVVDLYLDPPRRRGFRLALERRVAVEREEEERVGVAEVHAPKSVQLDPGETAPVEIEVTLQDELAAERRYRGRLPVVTAEVDLVVLASRGGAGEEEPPPRERRQRATPKKSSANRGAQR